MCALIRGTGLLAGGADSISVSGEGEVLVTSAACAAARFLCARVSAVHPAVSDTLGEKNCLCHSLDMTLECNDGKWVIFMAEDVGHQFLCHNTNG